MSEVYASDIEAHEKLARKNALMDSLQDQLKLNVRPNNAFLAGFKTYHSEQGAFEQLFENNDRNWHRFIAVLSELKSGDFPKVHSKDFGDVLATLD